MKKLSLLAPLLTFMTPLLAFAAMSGPNTDVIKPYSDAIVSTINFLLVPVLMAIAFIVFLWGVYKYFILGAADEKSRADGRQFVLWGVIGFVVLLAVWGLVNLVAGTLGLPLGGGSPKPPTFTAS